MTYRLPASKKEHGLYHQNRLEMPLEALWNAGLGL